MGAKLQDMQSSDNSSAMTNSSSEILPKNETVKWNKVNTNEIKKNGTENIANKVGMNQDMEKFMSNKKKPAPKAPQNKT